MEVTVATGVGSIIRRVLGEFESQSDAAAVARSCDLSSVFGLCKLCTACGATIFDPL